MDIEAIIFFIILIVISISLFVLPFIPAWLEWKNKTDAEPFQVNFLDKTIVDYTIRIFREFININFAEMIERYKLLDTYQTGIISSNIEYYITGQIGKITFPNTNMSFTNSIFLLCKNSILPGGILYRNKIYASDKLIIGSNSTLNEVITESDLQIDDDVTIQKLIYSEAAILIGQNCKAIGYIRARSKIHFLGDAQFQYLQAPTIEFGETNLSPKRTAIDVMSKNLSRIIEDNDLYLPAGTDTTSHCIAKGYLTIGDNCIVLGNIKCYQDIRIGKNTIIIGAIFGAKNLYIGDGCSIQGPIVISGSTTIGRNCFIGASDCMTSVVTHDLFISSGCFVTGLLLAKHQGKYTLEKCLS
jgi:predicted acyltransferase (DUF342 family)